LPGFGEKPSEWAVDRIVSHSGKGRDAVFELLWKSGDITWIQYHEIRHLEALSVYCEAMGITKITQLPIGTGGRPEFDEEIGAHVDGVRVSQRAAFRSARRGGGLEIRTRAEIGNPIKGKVCGGRDIA
jgi:hypothetical protein